MAVKLSDRTVRLLLGPDAGRHAYVALAFRGLGVSMWALTGVWGSVALLYSLSLAWGGDEHRWLLTPSWWVFVSLTAVWAVSGATGMRLFRVWERKALGDRYGELRLEPRADPSS